MKTGEDMRWHESRREGIRAGDRTAEERTQEESTGPKSRE